MNVKFCFWHNILSKLQLIICICTSKSSFGRATKHLTSSGIRTRNTATTRVKYNIFDSRKKKKGGGGIKSRLYVILMWIFKVNNLITREGLIAFPKWGPTLTEQLNCTLSVSCSFWINIWYVFGYFRRKDSQGKRGPLHALFCCKLESFEVECLCSKKSGAGHSLCLDITRFSQEASEKYWKITQKCHLRTWSNF